MKLCIFSLFLLSEKSKRDLPTSERKKTVGELLTGLLQRGLRHTENRQCSETAS